MRDNREQFATFQKMKRWFLGAQVSIGVSTGALLAIPFLGNTYFTELPPSYLITGMTFWLGLLGELVCYLMAAIRKKKYVSFEGKECAADKGLVGVLSFFRTKEGMIADIALGIAVVFLVLTVVLDWSGTWTVTTAVVFVFLTLQLHAMLNGKIYRVMREKKQKGKGES